MASAVFLQVYGTEMGVTPKGMLPPSSLSDTVIYGKSSETLSLGNTG